MPRRNAARLEACWKGRMGSVCLAALSWGSPRFPTWDCDGCEDGCPLEEPALGLASGGLSLGGRAVTLAVWPRRRRLPSDVVALLDEAELSPRQLDQHLACVASVHLGVSAVSVGSHTPPVDGEDRLPKGLCVLMVCYEQSLCRGLSTSYRSFWGSTRPKLYVIQRPTQCK